MFGINNPIFGFSKNGLAGSGALTSVPVGPNVLVVAPTNGDDATGAKGDRGKPFATVAGASGANASASSGDVVYVDGHLTEKDFVKNGVNYIVNGNVSYTGTDAGGLIDDTAATGQGGIIVSTIIVNGVFDNANPTTAKAPDVYCILLEDASSDITIKCVSIDKSVSPDNYGIDIQNGASLVVHANINTTVSILSASSLNLFGDLDNGITTSTTSVFGAGSVLNLFGNSTNDLGHGLSCGDTSVTFVSGFIESTNSSSQALLISSAIIRVEGYLSAVNSTSGGALFCVEINGTNKVEVLGGILNTLREAVFCSADSVNVFLYKTIESRLNTSSGHAILLASTTTNAVVLNNVVLKCANASANGVSNGGNAANQVSTNNGINVSVTSIDADIVQEVSTILVDADVKA